MSCTEEDFPSDNLTNIKSYPCDGVRHKKANGCLCKDGTITADTSDQACANHGGVQNWLCE